jgi:hypothetical protein
MQQITGGFFFNFVCTLFDTDSAAAHQTVSENAGIDPRSVVTLALTVRRCNQLARSHPHTVLG